MQLRDYQSRCVEAVFSAFEEYNSALVVKATGTGKTVTFGHIANRFIKNGKRVMVIAHRDELIQQAAEKMEMITGHRPDIEKAESYATTCGTMYEPSPIVIASIQSLISGRGDYRRMHRFDPDSFSLIIVDECHHAVSSSYLHVIEHFKQNGKQKILGVTATPDRSDEMALGRVFETVAYEYSIIDAIEDGYLVPIKQYCVTINSLNFDRVGTTAGDLNGADLAREMEYEKTMHEMALSTIEAAGDRKSIVFASSVSQAQRMAEIFNRYSAGSAFVIHAKTDEEERREMIGAFRDGRFQFFVNVGIAVEGFDVPDVRCIVMGRPTKSRSLYAQMMGRGTRPQAEAIDGLETAESRKRAIENSEKPDCLCLDFVGNCTKHRIIHAADVLGGDYPDEVVDLAKRELERSKKPEAVSDGLKKAERRLREQREQEEAARRSGIKAEVEYTAVEHSIYEFFGVPYVRTKGWDVGKKITSRQKAVIEKAGFDPDRMSYAQAKAALNGIFRRMDSGLCTYRQAKWLEKMGYENAKWIKFSEASAIISSIIGNRSRRTFKIR